MGRRSRRRKRLPRRLIFALRLAAGVADVDERADLPERRREVSRIDVRGTLVGARLERMIAQLGETSLEVRKGGKLAYPIVQRALLSIAVAARRKE